jgi:hypothetical protein
MMSKIRSLATNGLSRITQFHARVRRQTEAAVHQALFGDLRAQFDRFHALMIPVGLETIRRNFNPIEPKHFDRPWDPFERVLVGPTGKKPEATVNWPNISKLNQTEQDISYHELPWVLSARYFGEDHIVLSDIPEVDDLSDEGIARMADSEEDESEVCVGHAILVDDVLDPDPEAQRAAIAEVVVNPDDSQFTAQLQNLLSNLTRAISTGNLHETVRLYSDLSVYEQNLRLHQIRSPQTNHLNKTLAADFDIDDNTGLHPDDERVVFTRKFDFPVINPADDTQLATIDPSLKKIRAAQRAVWRFFFEHHPLFNNIRFEKEVARYRYLLTEGHTALAGQDYDIALARSKDITLISPLIRTWREDAGLLMRRLQSNTEKPIAANSIVGVLQARVEVLYTLERAKHQFDSRVAQLRQDLKLHAQTEEETNTLYRIRVANQSKDTSGTP